MDVKTLRKKLTGWFKKHGRDLPWRRERTPYATWISEMMLQQTQVKTMLPYFEAWMKAFPSIAALDRAPLDDLLVRWQGLGYYARARNIKKCARVLVERHGGRLPADYEALRELPGIGPYSAGAIASIGFNLKAPIVDGNVLRVLARLYAIEDPIDRPATRQKIFTLQSNLVPKRKPGIFNEALMELGALVCTPQNPGCGACPLASLCAARKTGRAEILPLRAAKIKITKIRAWAAVLKNNGRVFVHRRPEGRLMGGLWEFPEEKWKPGQAVSPEKEIQSAARRLELPVKSLKKVLTIKRSYTRFAETLTVYSASYDSPNTHGSALPLVPLPVSRGWESRWLKKSELARLPLTSAHAKIRAGLSF